MFDFPLKEVYKTLVSLEFLKGIWVLYLSVKEFIQCPKLERDPFMQVSSWIINSLYWDEKSNGI